jgi:hypothetical protein
MQVIRLRSGHATNGRYASPARGNVHGLVPVVSSLAPDGSRRLPFVKGSWAVRRCVCAMLASFVVVVVEMERSAKWVGGTIR